MAKQQLVAFSCDDGVSNKLSVHSAAVNKASEQPAILLIPALGIRAAKYEPLLASLANIGFSAASFDLRGNGHSAVRASRKTDFGYAEQVEQELPAALNAFESVTKNSSIVLVGHSLGGQVACLYASGGDTRIKKIILSASCSVYYKGWSGIAAFQILTLTQVANIVAQVVGHFPGRKLGFGGREARTLINDWASNARSGDYRLRGSTRDFCRQLQTLCLPITALNYQHDKFAPPAATDYLLAMMPQAKIERKLISAEQLTLTKADHFSWMDAPEKMAQLISGAITDEIL